MALAKLSPTSRAPARPGTLGDGDGVHGFVGLSGLFECCANHGNDVAQVFARGELRHDSFIWLVRGELREHDVRDHLFAGANNGGGGFVAGALDAKDKAMN